MLKINAYYSLLLAIALFSNNCPLLSSQINSKDALQRTCNGLAIYYEDMGIKDYYDSDGIGLFTKWFNQEEMAIDEMEEELQDDNAADCGYLDFDDNFPLKKKIDDENEKQTEIFKIIQKCYKSGSPYNNGSQVSKPVMANNKAHEKEKSKNFPTDQKKDMKRLKSIINQKGWESATPENINSVIRNGELAVLKYWKKEGESIKALYEGRNALHLACEYVEIGIVRWLIDECKFDINVKSRTRRHMNGATAFLYAAHVSGGYPLEDDNPPLKSLKEKKKWLRVHNESLEKYDKSLEICRLLKERGAKIYAEDNANHNALHWASFSGNLPVVKFLLDECGFKSTLKMEAKNISGWTPFLCAAKVGRVEILKVLYKRGANIHAKDYKGNNALEIIPPSDKVRCRKVIKYLTNGLGLTCVKAEGQDSTVYR